MALIRRESDCNGCGECVQCGRRFTSHPIYECDKCGRETTQVFETEDGEDYCERCYDELLESEGKNAE